MMELYPGLMLFPEINAELSYKRIYNSLSTNKECKVKLSNNDALNLMVIVLLENNRLVVDLDVKTGTLIIRE